MQEWGDGQGIALPTKPNPSGDDLQLVAWQQLAKSGWNRIISELNSIEQYPGFSVFLDFLCLGCASPWGRNLSDCQSLFASFRPRHMDLVLLLSSVQSFLQSSSVPAGLVDFYS